jgi:lysophospholipase L1-like esterase
MRAPTLLLAANTLLGAALASPASASDPELRADLEVVARRSIFFGHQSVGANILDGVRDLAAREGVPLEVVEIKGGTAPSGPVFGHAFVPENGNPSLKLKSFARALATLAAPPEIAFLKFCYVDIDRDTDVTALFEEYRSTLRELRARYPRTTFVHFTVPLTTVQGGWKAAIKSLIGRAPYGYRENGRREELNALLRAEYGPREPFFDIARIESTGPDGAAQAAEYKGRSVPVLAAAYTTDGGHLNGAGRRRVAAALLGLLASVPEKSAGAAHGAK